MKKTFFFILSLSIFVSANASDFKLVDKKATPETKALFYNLKKLQGENKILFGHQDATIYGRDWSGDENRSDVKDVTGDHPAMLALDFAGLTTTDSVRYKAEKLKLIKAVKEAYSRGGVITFCWHMSNPANGGSFYWEKDSVQAVPHMLSGEKYNKEYQRYMKAVASVVKEFKGNGGEAIPIIFRPYHEFDGDWFWWGKGHCSKAEFIALWQYTVKYFREDMKIHNFLYAFSSDCKFSSENEYLDYYPGDDYVDIIGFDDYWDFRPDGANDPALAQKKLKIVSDIAQRKNKVAALTETGLEGIPNPTWYTQTLLPILRSTKIAYVQAWRNAYKSETHYYVPTKGHVAEKDFIEFYKQNDILFESELPEMYKIK